MSSNSEAKIASTETIDCIDYATGFADGYNVFYTNEYGNSMSPLAYYQIWQSALLNCQLPID
jgi:hypothetical protein